MIRKPTKNTRGPTAEEKRFMAWVKDQPCIATEHPGPSIVHHCEGSCFKHNKVLIGHWFLLPLCQVADDVVTNGSRRQFVATFGRQSELWAKLIENSPIQPPDEVYEAIIDWGK